jgi:cephalosporin hydroxylase
MKKNLPNEDYFADITARSSKAGSDVDHQRARSVFFQEMVRSKYGYNFSWLGVPIIQTPQDIVTFQEMIWEVKPDLIIETGVARGGSVLFYASLLEILTAYGEISSPRVIGIDVDLRAGNRENILSHPASRYVTLLDGSSVDPAVVSSVSEFTKNASRVMVFLDSDHTHDHVLAELRLYSRFVTVDSFCVVLDTGIEEVDPKLIPVDRPWGKGNNPMTAVDYFLRENKGFMIDSYYEDKGWVLSAPRGILRRVG